MLQTHGIRLTRCDHQSIHAARQQCIDLLALKLRLFFSGGKNQLITARSKARL